ncbi:MAG: YebC/PmpR family DNA-binding transcriptional regulator [Deltaproteobacteria bacterium]|nr:YebC/PmpR family DNA-binding transcriptional regulator [Deltaproteobacteria bacterium]
MGAQWKHAGRQDSAARRGQVFGKLAKEIAVAARLGDPSPEHNARLRAAVESARKASMPRDTIERAIKKGAGLTGDDVSYDLVTYEGFTPHKVPVIIECLTDNKNRTASDIRVCFRKEGQLGAIGSVAWMFDRVGVIEAVHANAGIDSEGAAIEAGAQDVEPLEASEVESGQVGARFYTEPTDLDVVNKALTEAGWTVSKSELSYRAKSFVELAADARREVEEFLGDIDDLDDVHRVYAGIK